jgi:hypothetical protein
LLQKGPDGKGWERPSSSSDPEIAKQLGIITAIRAYEASLLNPPMPEPSAIAEHRRTRVLVALDPSLKDENVRAVVVRSPREMGMPVVLLRDVDATATDLDAALKAAALSCRDHPNPPSNEVRISIRASNPSSTATRQANNENVLDLIRRSNPYEIPGIGRLKATMIMTASATP